MRKKVLVVAMAIAIAANGTSVKGGEIIITNDVECVGYTNLARGITQLAISSSGKATVIGKITGSTSVTKVEMKVRLQRYSNSEKSWKNIKTWSVTKNSNLAQYSGSYQLTNAGKYRTKVKGTVYTKSSSEEVTATSTSKTY